MDFTALAARIKTWGHELGFRKVGICSVNLAADEARLKAWLERRYHGEMNYMARHGMKRARPAELVPGTLRVVAARMDYLPEGASPDEVLQNGTLAYVSRYALGRDYHKLVRSRLAKLASRMADATGGDGYRAFTDSAPVLEKALARDAGLGWIGKHTNLLDRHDGSWFFLGEIFTDLPLPVDSPVHRHCGSCTACIDVCPTRAIVAPYELDARRCISYLTIELAGPIPEEFRPAMGNRIYGCDDCQLVCPWNRYAKITTEPDFAPRHDLDAARLVDLFGWTEQQFLDRTAGSAIRRIGYARWLRNIAVALGNADASPEVIQALESRRYSATAIVREHAEWALARLRAGRSRDTADCRSDGHG